MASRRTPLAITAGLGMNSLMLWHRWIARWFWLHIVIHASAYTAIYIRRGGVADLLGHAYVKWGVAALSMMFGLVFLSLRGLRQRFYEVFVMLHIVMAFFAVLGTYLHIALIRSSRFQIFVVMTEIAAGVWAFDRAARITSRFWLSFYSPRLSGKSGEQSSSLIKCTTGNIRAFGSSTEFTLLRITVPATRLRFEDQHGLLGGIAAGDDIRVTIPRLQWVGEHPFTVFSTGIHPDDSTQGHIDLLIRTEAGLTRKLARHIGSQESQQEKDVEGARQHAEGCNVAVLIDSPFGVIPNIKQSTDLVLVSGGIAITFCWPLFVSAVKMSGTTKLNSCKLVWIVRKETTLIVLQKAFEQLVEDIRSSKAVKTCQFSLHIFVTSVQQAITTTGFSAEGQETSLNHSTACSSHSSSSTSVKEKNGDHDSTVSPGGDRSRAPSSEMVDGEAEPPKLADALEPIQDPTCHENIFSDGCHGSLIRVTLFPGRPKNLAASLFGHLDKQALQERRGLTIGFCGPPSLCDDVRVETVKLLKKGVHVELLEECFTW